MWLYQIINVDNGMFYIGSTKNIKRRLREHRNTLKNNSHHCQHLQNAWNKYGESLFSFVSFDSLAGSVEELHSIEQHLLNVYHNVGLLYNTAKRAVGGSVPSGIDNPAKRLDVRLKLKQAWVERRKRGVSLETRQKISATSSGSNNGMYGKTHSPETRALIGERSGQSRLGVKRSKGRT